MSCVQQPLDAQLLAALVATAVGRLAAPTGQPLALAVAAGQAQHTMRVAEGSWRPRDLKAAMTGTPGRAVRAALTELEAKRDLAGMAEVEAGTHAPHASAMHWR